MGTIVRVVIWSLLLSGYLYFCLCKKNKSEFSTKIEISFTVVTAYVLLTIMRSVAYRVANMMGLSVVFQEILSAVGIFIAYTVICKTGGRFLKERFLKFKYFLVSLTWLFSICLFILCGRITNEFFFGIYVLAFLGAFIVAGFFDQRIEISGNRVWKGRLKFSLPVGLFTGCSLFLYLPSELYLGNPKAFMVEYMTFILPLTVIFVLFVAAYLLLTLCFVTTKHYYLCNIFCLTFTLMSNVQNMLLNGTMQSMDGTRQQWSTGAIAVNVCLWLGVSVAVGIAYYLDKKKVRDIFKAVGYLGTCIQMVALAILLIVTLPTVKFDNYVLSTEKTFETAPKNNVFVFVLDWFDNQIIEQITAEDEEFLKPLDGFIHYTNATSKYAFTDMSLPYLLTGVEWEFDQLEAEYARKANAESDVLETIADAGHAVGLYTEAAYIGKDEHTLVENGREAKWSLDVITQLQVMAKTARYKTYPFALKNCFFYSDDDILNMRRTDVEIHNIYNDVSFAKRLMTDGVTVDGSKSGSFKLYHLHGAHTSYIMNEQFENEETDMLTQSRAVFKVIFEFIDQLKEKGLYEDAMIIITADHGQNYFDRAASAEELGLKLISSPVMFVKDSGSYATDMTISKAPVSHEEVIPTVLENITGKTNGSGNTFKEIRDDEERERTFIFGRHSDIPFVEYTITGDAMKLESWSEPKVLSKE